MRKLLLLLMSALLLASLPISHAQTDDLTAEELALLERIIAGAEYIENLPAYVINQEEIQASSTVIFQDGTLAQEQNLEEIRQSQRTFLETETGPTARETVTVQELFEGETVVTNGTLVYVDERLFVAAAYETGSPTYGFEFTQTGFVELADPAAPSVYDVLEPEDFVEAITEEDEDPELTVEALSQAFTTLSVENAELDGTPVEIISLEFDTEGFLTLSEAQGQPVDESTASLFEASTTNGAFQFFFGPDDAVLATILSVEIVAEGVDFAVLNPDAPAGITLDFTFSSSDDTRVVTTDPAEIEPITIPPGIE